MVSRFFVVVDESEDFSLEVSTCLFSSTLSINGLVQLGTGHFKVCENGTLEIFRDILLPQWGHTVSIIIFVSIIICVCQSKILQSRLFHKERIVV